MCFKEVGEEENLNKKSERKLKIYPKYKARSNSRTTIVPEIRLCGIWLKKYGFKQGDFVAIVCEENVITITAVKD